MCNPTFVLISLAAASEYIYVTGITTFGVKVVQSLFTLTPTESSTFVGETDRKCYIK